MKKLIALLTLMMLLVGLAGNAGAAAKTTLITPGSLVFVQLEKLDDNSQPEVLLIEFDKLGKGAIAAEDDLKRIVLVASPEDKLVEEVTFHHYYHYRNYFRRAEMSKLLVDIDQDKLGFWGKVKTYSKEAGAFVLEKGTDFANWLQNTKFGEKFTESLQKFFGK